VGGERATLLSRGVSLAPRGSARDEVVREALRRERAERFARVELFARLLSAGLGIADERVASLLDAYRLELSQDRYRPAAIAAARKTRTRRRQKAKADKTLLSRVDALTVRDEDLPPSTRGRPKA
jgi:hypothetical protein